MSIATSELPLRVNTGTTTGVEQMGAGRAVLLQLLPGITTTAVFVLVAPFVRGLGWPVFFTLAIAIAFGEVPASWIVMARQVRRETGSSFRVRAAFPWHEDVPWWLYLVGGVPLIVISMVVMVGVAPSIGGPIRRKLFGWIPESMVMELNPETFSSLPEGVLVAMWLVGLIVLAILGGVTQELYSRGFLLPRTENLGAVVAPPLNALAFGVFHLIAPWNWIPFALMALPWSYLVWWRRSIRIGLFIHVGMLLLQNVMMGLLIFGVVQLPAR